MISVFRSSLPYLGWILGAGLLAVAAGSAVSRGPILPLAITVGALAVSTLAAASGVRRAQILCVGGLVSIMSASAEFQPDDDPTPGLMSRLVGVVLILSALSSQGSGQPGYPRAASTVFLPVAVTPLLVFAGAATLPHGEAADFLERFFGLAVLGVAIFAMSRVEPKVLVPSVAFALTFVVIVSIVLGLLQPGSAIEQGRLRGFFENANTLGYFAFSLGAVATLTVRNVTMRWVMLGLAALVLVWTASRGSALALGVLVLLLLVSRRPSRGLLIVALAAVALFLIAVLWPSAFAFAEVLLRANNSREGSFAVAIEAVSANLLWGLGPSADFAASSFLGAAAYGGIVGLAAIVGFWIGVLHISRKQAVQVGVFAVAAAIHSIFEAWLLSPISPMLLVFAATWWSVSGFQAMKSGDAILTAPSKGPVQ